MLYVGLGLFYRHGHSTSLRPSLPSPDHRGLPQAPHNERGALPGLSQLLHIHSHNSARAVVFENGWRKHLPTSEPVALA
jgi:hypothetical protein